MKVGFGKADITPPVGTLCALGLGDEAEEILDPISIRATVIEQGSQIIGPLSADLIGLCRTEVDDLRGLIAARTRLSFERIIIHATHTHESPSVRLEWSEITRPWGLVWHNASFYERVQREAVCAFRQALDNRFEAALSFGQSPVAGIASNRRITWPDGRVTLRGSRSTAELRRFPEGWIDPYIRLVVFRDATGAREHWLLNYCCHPTAAGGDEGPYITADFPGEAIRCIEQARPDVSCTYFTGCCGNINPGKYTASSNAPQDRRADVVKMGRLLADAALRAREDMQPVKEGQSAWAVVPVRLPLQKRMLDGAALEKEVATHAQACLQSPTQARGGGPLAKKVNNLMVYRQSIDGVLNTEVAAWGVGDLALVFFPGECFLELDAALRGQFPGKKLITVEGCDYTTGYIVPQEAYQRGGYEARAATCAPECHEQLIQAGKAIIRQNDEA